MEKRQIREAAIARNRAWIEAVGDSLCRHGDPALARCVMRDAGKRCAAQILEQVIDHYGREPQSVDELIEAMNARRRDVLNVTTLWVRKGDRAHFKLAQCGCDLVEAGLAEPSPAFCLCSAGMFENLFAPFHDGEVRTEIVKAIGHGDDCCEFIVHLGETSGS